MGYETIEKKKTCGCVEYYTFMDACGMGAIHGTDSTSYVFCKQHKTEKTQKDVNEKLDMIKKLQDEVKTLLNE